MNRKYVIIGAGIAGLSAAEAIREADPEGGVAIFSAESRLPYSRPMLTKAPFASFDPADWTIYGEEWFASKRIELKRGERVTAIDAQSHTVASAAGVYHYDKLILAMGAENFIPPIKGADGDNVFSIRRPEDILAIKRACRQQTRAVIIGGGVIGLEAALELRRYGAQVAVLEAMPYLMTRQIDQEISDLICAELSGKIAIRTAAAIEEISAGPQPAVVLKDGTRFPCDLVVVACGVRASTAIVPPGVKAPRAIEIDEYCRTTEPDVFAAGDCAQYDGVNYALWSQALTQGRIAGLNAAADLNPAPAAAGPDGASAARPQLEGFDTSLVINSPELSLFALGDLGKDPDKDYEIKYFSTRDGADTFFVNPAQGRRFEKLCYLDGRLVGAAVVGNLSDMEKLKAEIAGKEATR